MLNALLKIIHFLLNSISCISDAIDVLQSKYYNFLYNYVLDKRSVFNDIMQVRKFDKVPVHLTILLGDEEPSVKDLSNIILWSLLSGISFISFFDNQGILNKQEKKIQNEVDKLKLQNQHVIWHSNHNSKHKNGYNGDKVHVNIYSEVDARENIVQETKKLIKTVKPSQIDMKYLDERFKENYEFPDPDMGIYFGKSFFLHGYPPWQIRITEFFNIKTHHNINFKKFILLMRQFSKCERRLGK